MFRVVSLLILLLVLTSGTAHAQSPQPVLPQRTWHEWYVILQDSGVTFDYVARQKLAEHWGVSPTDPRVLRATDNFTEYTITAPFLAAKYLEAGYDIRASRALYEFYAHAWSNYAEVFCFIRHRLSDEQIRWMRDVFENEAARRAAGAWTNTVYNWYVYIDRCNPDGTVMADPSAQATPTPVLHQAATVMATTPTGQGLMASWQELGTVVEWKALREGTYAHYDPNRERIVFNQRYYQEFSVDLLAAVLAHEIIHAYLHQVAREGRPLASKEGCEAEEVLAYTVGLVWWYERFGIAGKPNPNQLDQGQNHMLEIWLKAAASQVQAGLSEEEATAAVLALIRKEAEGTHHIGYCDTYPSVKRD